MNILEDRTGWILPPRCAARYTTSILWKYGLISFAGHNIDPFANVEKIVMNVRDPITRFASWYRLMKLKTSMILSFDEYIENLVVAEYPHTFTTEISDLDMGLIRYPVPLYRYVEILGRKPDHYVRVEHIERDMDAAGYPVRDHTYVRPEEGELDFTYKELQDHERYGKIIRSIYQQDFDLFGY